MKNFVLGLACSFLLLAVRPSWTMEEAPSSSPVESSSGNLDLGREVDPDSILGGLEVQDSPVKRAYTYVSEYKRLPIYNFGLGKRWSAGNNADEEKVRFNHRFRTVPSRTRTHSCSSSGACNPFFQRARLYSFGLGKRARPYSFGLGKRGGDSSPSSSFIIRGEDYEELGREQQPAAVDDYLEKRSRSYSFGLGKRMAGDERGGSDFGGLQRFNFGLGKRPSEDFGHRYKFGLGKRRLIVDDDDDDDDDDQQLTNLAS